MTALFFLLTWVLFAYVIYKLDERISDPHCGKMHGVDLNVLSMLCKHCGNTIKLMWENKINDIQSR